MKRLKRMPFAAARIIGFRDDGRPIYGIAGAEESQGFIPVRASTVAEAGLNVLERDTVLAALIWRDPISDFRGQVGDTVSIRLPAYAVANSRRLRSSDPRARRKLFERKVDITLDTDIQIDIPLTDEEQTLDITNFSQQVVQPALNAEVRGIEDAVIGLMEDASYEVSIPVGATNVDDPDSGLFAALVDARTALNNARVPMEGRAAVIGSSLEAQALKDPRLARVDQSGSATALREAEIGRLAGFTIYTAPGLSPDRGFAFHRTAYALSTAAPIVPDGAPWGARETANGFTIRVVQVLDPDTIENIVAFDTWLGTALVTDRGALDADGRFTPAEDPDESGADDLLVRAVELTAAS